MSEAEMSEAKTSPVSTSAPLGVQIMLVERSRDDAFQASFQVVTFLPMIFIVTIISTLCKKMQFLAIHVY
jgi:hypothetical protein